MLPTLLRFHASSKFDAFRDALAASCPNNAAFEPDDPDGGQVEANSTAAVRRMSITAMVDAGKLVIRYVRSKCVKKEQRMSAKVVERQQAGDASTWPCTAMIGDALRASVVAKDTEGLRSTWEHLRASDQWRVVRLKNKFRTACEELTGRGADDQEGGTTFPDLHLNVLFGEGGEAPIVAEIQVHLLDVMKLKKESHKLYRITRATGIEELRPKSN